MIPVKDFDARAKNIRAQWCHTRGTLATFEDKLTVLTLYSHFVLDDGCRTHNKACKSVAIGLQMTLKTVLDVLRKFDHSRGEVYQMAISHKTTRGMASSSYYFEHCIIKKEMLMFCHEYCLKNLTNEGALSSYAELHRVFEEQYNLGVSSNALRPRLIKDFNDAFFPIHTVWRHLSSYL